MRLTRRSFVTTSLMALPTLAYGFEPEQNWPEFRGPGARSVADGFATRATWNVNETGKDAGVLWRTEIPGLGHASPIIWKDRIYLVTAVPKEGKPSLRIGYYGDPKSAQDNDEQRWMILCLDKKSGRKK